jgi:hypothetical protein
MLNTSSPPDSSDSLEEQLVKARSSMALQPYLMSFSNRVHPHKREKDYFN